MALAWSCTKAEAKRRCTVKEFAEWIAYDRIDPIGEQRADLRMAVLATVVARSGGSKTAKPSDFIPRFDAPKAEPTSVIKAKLMAIAEAHNARNAELRRRQGK